MQKLEILAEKNPESLFSKWLTEAKAHSGLREPTAMILATVNAAGHPSSRTVLLKDHQAGRFLFFTNYESKKGQDLASQPFAALTFYWDPLFKQIHIRGPVQKADRQVALDYWQTRPRASQLSQWVSHQSQPLKANVDLDALVESAEKQWAGKEIPCPNHWGGYWVEAQEVEFWIGARFRLHDRFLFTKSDPNNWRVEQLYP